MPKTKRCLTYEKPKILECENVTVALLAKKYGAANDFGSSRNAWHWFLIVIIITVYMEKEHYKWFVNKRELNVLVSAKK